MLSQKQIKTVRKSLKQQEITYQVNIIKSFKSSGRDLGKGTFGKVKVGTHVLTGEKVAVKILEKDKIADVSDVERVAREIHILKIVRHPHVV